MSTAVYSGETCRVPVSRCSEKVRLAALAAGATVVEAGSSVLRGAGLYVVDGDAGRVYRIMPDGSFRWFDPENDDGDAFYLIWACKLSVEYEYQGKSITVANGEFPFVHVRSVIASGGSDMQARSAIVVAASEIQRKRAAGQ